MWAKNKNTFWMASLTLIFTRSVELRTHKAVRPRGLQSANWPREDQCQRSHAHGFLSYYSMDAIGWLKEAQWWYKWGRSIAQIHTQCMQQYAFLLRGDQWLTPVHPFCDHGNVCAFLLSPLSDLWVTNLLGDLCATVLNMIKTSRQPWRP